MEQLGKILIVDDNEDVLFALNLLLEPYAEKIKVAVTPDRIEYFMTTFQPDIILLDMNFSRDAISGQEGFESLEQILRIDPQAVVIFMTAYADTDKAVRAIKAGATDFIPKPWEKEKLLATLSSGIKLRRSRCEVNLLKEQVEVLSGAGSSVEESIIGESAAMQEVFATIEKLRDTDANILVLGENGTGKDVIARLLYRCSPRYGRPFVTIDLGSIPEQLFESELFGYEKGAFVDANSPYRHFFKFYNQNAWPYNDDYDGWWGHKTLPKLNYEESRQLYDYILNVGRKWVSPPYNADGWRLDVAADLGQSEDFNHQFWRDFRTAVKEANPEAIILAEHYEDAGSWLMGDQWDTIMNYSAFMEPVTWFLTGMEKHSDERRGDLLGNTQAFVDAMVYHMSRFQYPSLMVSMNELSNHDHSRFLTRTNQTVGRTASMGAEAANQNVNKGIMRAAVMIQMTWPGAPTLYYGDEAGLCGWTDPDNRRTYPWGREDQNLIQYHRDIIAIHKEEEALMKGSLKYLYGGFKVLGYGRFTDTEKMVVLINSGFDEARVKVSVWEVGVTDDEEMVEVIMSNEEGYTMEKKVHPVTSGVLDITLPRVSAILLKAVEIEK